MADSPVDDDAELRKSSNKRAKLMFWLAVLVLVAFAVPQIIMAWYQGTTGKLPV